MSIYQGRPLSFAKFKEIYSTVNRLNIEIVLQTEQGTLLSLRDIEPYKGQWHLPGGTVYFREPVEVAVLRVAKQELGLDVKIQDFLGYIEYPSVSKNNGFDSPIGLAFRCALINSDSCIKLDEQSSKAKFFKKIPKNTILEQKVFLDNI
jgi:hypothetical protein